MSCRILKLVQNYAILHEHILALVLRFVKVFIFLKLKKQLLIEIFYTTSLKTVILLQSHQKFVKTF